jgi:peptidoglycan L-alanyl-D-glutamate endopeptidase CwlK
MKISPLKMRMRTMGKLLKSERLNGVQPDLVQFIKDLSYYSPYDLLVVEGVRSLDTQRSYVARGVSKTLDSKHLTQPDGFGHAVDLAIMNADGTVNWADAKGDARSYYFLGGIAKQASTSHPKLKLRWGGDWDGDGDFKDQTFNDLVHVELT